MGNVVRAAAGVSSGTPAIKVVVGVHEPQTGIAETRAGSERRSSSRRFRPVDYAIGDNTSRVSRQGASMKATASLMGANSPDE
jgi:hypothetical protein